MSIKRLNGAGISGTKSTKVWDQTTTLNDYQSIATIIVPSGGQASVVFNGIPQNFAHLQLRAVVFQSATAWTNIQFNTDTSGSGTNYAYHELRGNGSSATSSASFSQPYGWTGLLSSTSYPGAQIIDIFDYTSTSKNKTVRTLHGQDQNGAGQVGISSSLWNNASIQAITSITLVPTTGAFNQYTQFALYGIKAAS